MKRSVRNHTGAIAEASTPARSPVGPPLGRAWFATDAVSLARRLLGRILVRRLNGELLAGRIVETEAYCGIKDAASHAYRGRRTARNEAMYGPPGTAYVYFTYGMHYCMNVVCGSVGDPSAVLLRALEPIEDMQAMRRLRKRDDELCSGPARLCQAMAIDGALNGLDLVGGGPLYIAEPADAESPPKPRRIRRAARIGIDYAGAWAARPLRFLIADSPHVSRRVRPGG